LPKKTKPSSGHNPVPICNAVQSLEASNHRAVFPSRGILIARYSSSRVILHRASFFIARHSSSRVILHRASFSIARHSSSRGILHHAAFFIARHSIVALSTHVVVQFLNKSRWLWRRVHYIVVISSIFIRGHKGMGQFRMPLCQRMIGVAPPRAKSAAALQRAKGSATR
jgi:cytochrome c biogenesis protein CcdA